MMNTVKSRPKPSTISVKELVYRQTESTLAQIVLVAMSIAKKIPRLKFQFLPSVIDKFDIHNIKQAG